MKKLSKVEREVVIKSSKEKLWDILFNRFGQVNNFNPLIDGSHHTKGTKGEVGCERFCEIDDKNSVHEKIVSRDGTDSFDIEIIQGNLPMMSKMTGRYLLERIDGETTRVRFISQFAAKPSFISFLMKAPMGNMLIKMLVGLKYYSETGNLVTKQNIKSILAEFSSLEVGAAFARQDAVAA